MSIILQASHPLTKSLSKTGKKWPLASKNIHESFLPKGQAKIQVCFVLFLSEPYSNLQSASFTVIESLSGSPPGSYSQLIPSHHTPVTVRDGMHSSVPPVLPPHLLHVILNKEVVDHNDPSLLPEPDHVSLNHLYALSIKVILVHDVINENHYFA